MSAKTFETVTLEDRGTDGRVIVEVSVISLLLPEEPASIFLTLEIEGSDVEVIADLTPAMARKLSNALNDAAADAAHLNTEAGQ